MRRYIYDYYSINPPSKMWALKRNDITEYGRAQYGKRPSLSQETLGMAADKKNLSIALTGQLTSCKITKQAACATEDQVKSWSFYHGPPSPCLISGYCPRVTFVPSARGKGGLPFLFHFMSPTASLTSLFTTLARQLTTQTQHCLIATLVHATRWGV